MSKHKFTTGICLYDRRSGEEVCTVVAQLRGVDCNMYTVLYVGDECPVLRSETVLLKYYQPRSNKHAKQ